MANNPRWKSGRRRTYQARFRAMNAPCGICKGKLGEIHYDEPSDAAHPLSFVIDEIIPVSRWREAGYDSPAAAADDWNNLQAAHRICNARKGNKLNYVFGSEKNKKNINNNSTQKIKKIIIDGKW